MDVTMVLNSTHPKTNPTTRKKPFSNPNHILYMSTESMNPMTLKNHHRNPTAATVKTHANPILKPGSRNHIQPPNPTTQRALHHLTRASSEPIPHPFIKTHGTHSPKQATRDSNQRPINSK